MDTKTESQRILVWDWPTRLFHWSLVVSFAGAWLTAESERLALWHMTFGFTLLGLIAFRLVWGVVGTRYALFRNFITGPAAVVRYLRSLLSPRPEHHVGHNPAGAVAIVLLLLLGIATALSGWAQWAEWGGESLEEVHEALATTMLVIVGVHVAGVILSTVLHRENLVGAMLSGFKRGDAGAAIPRGRPLVALLLLAALLAFWAYAWSPSSFLRQEAAEGGGPVATKAGDD
ncbi:MAG TPA: cytochrome b/b6 domain-containing protein [Moraxellaceae bacterium]|nr:cytochrome b/b6 domain-containing protein [Moraxellaceae bacterium]